MISSICVVVCLTYAIDNEANKLISLYGLYASFIPQLLQWIIYNIECFFDPMELILEKLSIRQQGHQNFVKSIILFQQVFVGKLYLSPPR